MVNSGIDNVSIIVRQNYHSLMDHLGSGREWDLTRKNGGLNIVPPFAEKNVKIYNGRVEALASVLSFLQHQKEKYVVMSDANIAVNFDFSAFLDAHIQSGADVTVAYTEEELPESSLKAETDNKALYYTLDLEKNRVNNIKINSRSSGIQNFSMNIYAIERELLIDQIRQASVRGYVYYERDILSPHLVTLNVQGYKYEGYTARISDMGSYFKENMKMLDDANVDALFADPIYTKIRDDNPTRYIPGSKVKNIMAADGCVIEGEVENSILFRGVKVGKGAKVKNCVLMQDTVVEAGADIQFVISDKNVVISEGKELKGTDTFQVFVEKGKTV
jgi:glucose-1-phosphate adenylyltransferase